MGKSRIDEDKVREWLEKVYKREKKKREEIWNDWPLVELSSSQRMIDENVSAVPYNKKMKGKGADYD